MGIIFLTVFIFSDRKLEHSARFASDIMVVLGCFLVGAATVGRLWCAQYIAGYKTDVLVMEGPYSMCRNPLYFFSLLGGMGAGLRTESLVLTLAVAAVFAVIYPVTIRNEEAKLSGVFGSAYDDYVRRVPRFFPKISLFSEPAEYIVNPKIFRREVFDAVYFVWIVGFFEFFEGLTELEIIKPFISIW
ncbi:MAG: isoprenylcysteine carboxylmethyltransferase family protein [Synergistaceae bacterium]|nr:isoprenylcysteine carboxylmethyltransferase family protein [Synergistaceae bacterium]